MGECLQRQRWPRLPLAIPVFVRGADTEGRDFIEFSTLLNESAGGALLAIRRSLRASSRISLEIPSAPAAPPAAFPPRSPNAARARCPDNTFGRLPSMWGAIRPADWPRAKYWNTVMRKATQFTLRIHDRPGLFADIASALWNKAASIRAFSADVKGPEGILRLVVDKVRLARKAFEENALKAREEEVIVLTLPNKPESLALVAAKLAKSKVKILYGYTGSGEKRAETNTYLGVSDVRKALKILRQKTLKPIAKSATRHDSRAA